MVGRDPAVEAAQRAWTEDGWPGALELSEGHLAVAAAREALKPIREECQQLREFAESLDGAGMSETVLGAGIRQVLDAVAPLIYTSEEESDE